MALGRFKTVEDMADGVVLGSYILRDMQQKIGKPIVDNRNYIYAGGADDNMLNDDVKRYTATDEALDYLKTWYTPTGVLAKPMLAVHTTYDPLIPPESVSVYADLAQRMGSSRNFAQQYVKADGHCNISGPQTMAALEELIQWKRTGVGKTGSGSGAGTRKINTSNAIMKLGSSLGNPREAAHRVSMRCVKRQCNPWWPCMQSTAAVLAIRGLLWCNPHRPKCNRRL